MAKLDIGVTGGSPTLLGSLTAAARNLPENADWQQFGTSHIPENCGKAWVWQACTAVALVPGGPCVDEVQELTITGAVGGDFQLTANPVGAGAQTTAPIPHGSSAAVVQAALELLLNVDPGDIVVGGAPDVYTFTYGGQYACLAIAPIVADCTGLESPEPGAAPVDLLTAESYGILAGSTVTNTGFTVIDGDLGLSPGAAVVGFPPGVVLGTQNVANPAAVQAKTDLTAAYLDAEGRTADFGLDVYGGDIGGEILVPGVYETETIPSVGITGTVTLDAGGDANAVWIFQIESTLITAAGADVVLVNGAQSCNVFWQVGSSATLGTTTEFVGTILALTAITANNNANVDGRLLARNAAVTLDDNDVTVPTCVVAPPVEATCDVETLVEGAPETTDSFTQKPLNDAADAVDFHPFLVEYNAQSCAGIPSDWEQLADRAKRGLSVRAGIAIALALSSSAPDGQPNDSPSLPTTATDSTPVGGPSNLVNTVAGLIQDAYACGATGELFIHAPAWTLPHWLNETLIVQNGNVWKLGPHTVVLDQGYTNEAPTGGDAAGVGEAWIYVTGPIEYALASINVLDDTTRGVSPRVNHANVIAAQLAIYRFDPCCIYAALAEVC